MKTLKAFGVTIGFEGDEPPQALIDALNDSRKEMDETYPIELQEHLLAEIKAANVESGKASKDALTKVGELETKMESGFAALTKALAPRFSGFTITDRDDNELAKRVEFF